MESSQYYHQKIKSSYEKINFFHNNIFINSSSISINKFQKDHFFPSDFFDPINSPKNTNQIKPIIPSCANKSKSTFISLQKEEDEVKELIDLLDGKRKKIEIIIYYFLYFYIYSIYKSKQKKKFYK